MNADARNSPLGSLGRKTPLYFTIGVVVFVLFTGISVLACGLANGKPPRSPMTPNGKPPPSSMTPNGMPPPALMTPNGKPLGSLSMPEKRPKTLAVICLPRPLRASKSVRWEKDGWKSIKRIWRVFNVQGTFLEYKLHNRNKYGNVKPHFALIFYDDNGVTTGIADVYWLVQTVAPNEDASDKQVINGPVSSRPSKYFRVEFH